MASRRIGLSSCLGSLSWLTGERFTSLQKRFGIDPQQKLSEAELLERQHQIETWRNQFLEKLRAYERKRIREKMRGQRHPRKADLKKLYSHGQ